MSKREEILERLRALAAEAAEVDGLLDEMRSLLGEAQTVSVPAVEGDDGTFFGMVGECPALIEVRALCNKFAPVSAPV